MQMYRTMIGLAMVSIIAIASVIGYFQLEKKLEKIDYNHAKKLHRHKKRKKRNK